MQQRALGRTGRSVSAIGLGTWQLGADWGDVSEEDATAVLAASADHGVTLFDSADVYGDGRSESIIGRFLAGRGDHGIEGFTEGVNGDTDRWNTNTGTNGVIVEGDRVTATGLFVEHFQQFNTQWNGEDGHVVLYQNELPYDPPTQADWTQPDGTLGYPGYKVADDVTTHRLDGAGVYVFNQNNPSILTENGFEAPETPGVQLHHIMTVNLSAGTIQHVVNGIGGQADTTKIGVPQYVVDYPAP